MAFTDFGYFNQSSGGAPTLSGTQGDLYTLLHYAFTTISNWVRIFNTGVSFSAVWQPAAGGATPCIGIQDNSAVSGDARAATLRIMESATSSTGWTDPAPTVAQVANGSSIVSKSSVASSTTRDYHCVVWETGIVLAIKTTGVLDQWDIYFAGKCFQRLTSLQDPWPWAIMIRGTANYTTAAIVANQPVATAPTSAGGKVFMLRNAQGTIKSEYAIPEGRGSSMGAVGNTAAVGGGYLGSVDKYKLTLLANGGSTSAAGSNPILSRLCVPQWFQMAHSGYAGITETDTVNDGSHTALALRSGSGNCTWLLTSNTHSGFPQG